MTKVISATSARLDTRGTTVSFSIFGAIYVFVSLVVSLTLLSHDCWQLSWLAAQTIAILLAGGIYLWYTYETKLLRRYAAAQHDAALEQLGVSQRQFALSQAEFNSSIRPLVVALKTKDADELVLRNDGNAPAINIHATAYLDPTDTGKPVTIILQDSETSLAIGDTSHIGVRVENEDGRRDERTFIIVPGSTSRVVRVQIHYQDTAMRHYTTHVLINNDRYHIESFDLPS